MTTFDHKINRGLDHLHDDLAALTEEDANEIEIHLREIEASATPARMATPESRKIRSEIAMIRMVLIKVLVAVNPSSPHDRRLTRASRLKSFSGFIAVLTPEQIASTLSVPLQAEMPTEREKMELTLSRPDRFEAE